MLKKYNCTVLLLLLLFFCLMFFILYFFIHFFSWSIIIFRLLYRSISCSPFLRFYHLNIMYDGFFSKKRNDVGVVWMAGMHANWTIVFRIVFALTCTSYFCLFVFGWWLVVVGCFSTLSLSPTRTHSLSPILVSFFVSLLYLSKWFSIAPNDCKWLWWTFMHLKLYEKRNETMPTLKNFNKQNISSIN